MVFLSLPSASVGLFSAAVMAIAALIGAGAGLFAHANSRRISSGSVETSDASDLWESLTTEMNSLRSDMKELRAENRLARDEMRQLRAENVALRQENSVVRDELQSIRDENVSLRRENAQFKAAVERAPGTVDKPTYTSDLPIG